MPEFHLVWGFCGIASAVFFLVSATILNAINEIRLKDFVSTVQIAASDIPTLLFVLVVLAIFGPMALLTSLIVLGLSMIPLINILCKQFIFRRY